MKVVRQLVLAVSTAGFFATCQTARAGDKKLIIDSTPTGAQVDVNGSITCTTPCTLNVSGGYFGAKHTVFSAHVDQPLSIRLLKEGYLPKSVLLTSGPHVWRSFNGQNTFEYYLIDSDHFNFRLDPIQAFLGPSNASLEETDSPSDGTSGSIQPELIVRNSLPSIVQVQTSEGSGSGFFITADGLVATNAHVIGGQQSAQIITSSGATLNSIQIYVDQDRDLALIKVNAREAHFLEVSPKLPMQGADVIAIGTPGAHDVSGTVLLPNTVTKGVVSGIRQFSDTTVANVPGRAGNWIQTDAAINHGNSGGPLLNRFGVVVGVNTLTFSNTGTPGINFALASTELIDVVRSRLGISLAPASKSKPDTTASASAKLSIASTPPGADIEIDGAFLGSTPSDVTVKDGPRVVKITKRGFKPYERTIQAQPNGVQRLTIELDPNDK